MWCKHPQALLHRHVFIKCIVLKTHTQPQDFGISLVSKALQRKKGTNTSWNSHRIFANLRDAWSSPALPDTLANIVKHCLTYIGTATGSVTNIKKKVLAEPGNLCCRLSPHSQGVPSHWNPIYHSITRAGWVKTSSIHQLRKCTERCQKSWNRTNMRTNRSSDVYLTTTLPDMNPTLNCWKAIDKDNACVQRKVKNKSI